MKNKGVFFFFLAIIFGMGMFQLVSTRTKAKNARDAFRSTAIVTLKTGTGSGLILDTGYLITAAHVIDKNRDEKLSLSERKVDLGFGGIKETNTGRVLFADFKNDFAILEVDEPRDKSIASANGDLIVGDIAHTIGCMSGLPPMMTSGRASYSEDEYSRLSCPVSGGSSGGGVFNKDFEFVGVTTAVGLKQVMNKFSMSFLVPNGDDLTMVIGGGILPTVNEINHICYYVTVDTIRKVLKKKNLSQLLDKTKEPSLYERISQPWPLGIIRVAINLSMFLGTIFFYRKYLFS